MAEESGFDQRGLLSRKGASFVLACDSGGEVMLELSRVPVDLVGKRVRLIGRRRADEVVEVEGVSAASGD